MNYLHFSNYPNIQSLQEYIIKPQILLIKKVQFPVLKKKVKIECLYPRNNTLEMDYITDVR